MYNTGIISEQDHLSFIENLRNREDCYYWCVYDNEKPIGVVNIIDVEITQFDTTHDCALLKINAEVTVNVMPNMFGDPDKSPVGANILYFGYPFGDKGLHTLKVSSSIISSKAISNNNTKHFQLDSMVHDGNSGGPLVDIHSGQIIGMISGKFNPSGNSGGIMIGNYALGTESSISYATSIEYGINLMREEGLNV